MFNCCASGRVYFLGGVSFVCLWVCLCYTHMPICCPKGEGLCVWVYGVSVELKSWNTAVEQSTSRSPGRHWSLGNPSNEKGWDNAHCSSERVVRAPSPQYAYIIALLVWHGVWVLFFLKGLKRWSPPPNGNMKPFVLLFSLFPVSTFLSLSQAFFLPPLPSLCVWALHSGSCNIPVFELSLILAP